MRSFLSAAVVVVVALAASAECSRPGEVPVREVHLTNVNFATVTEQQQISQSFVGRCVSPDADELRERIKQAFQNHGFFKAEVPDVAVESGALTAKVEEGSRYRLGSIEFNNYRAISNPDVLRNMFDIKIGGIFTRSAIADGLEKLRQAYGELGYINFTPVPETVIDEPAKTIRVIVNLDEGPQFVIRHVSIMGEDPQQQGKLMESWPEYLQPGKVYNARLFFDFLAHSKLIAPQQLQLGRNIFVETDDKSGTVDIRLCPRCVG